MIWHGFEIVQHNNQKMGWKYERSSNCLDPGADDASFFAALACATEHVFVNLMISPMESGEW